MQTTTETIAKVRRHIEKVAAEQENAASWVYTWVIRHVENKLPVVLVDIEQSLVGFRLSPSVLEATRGTEQWAKNTAAGINNAYPEYSVEAVPYLDALASDIANAKQVIAWLEQNQQ